MLNNANLRSPTRIPIVGYVGTNTDFLGNNAAPTPLGRLFLEPWSTLKICSQTLVYHWLAEQIPITQS